MIVQILILTVLLVLVPTMVGGVAAGVERRETLDGVALLWRWVSGQIVLWAGFQVICVPMILAQRKFHDVVVLFSGYMAVLVLMAVVVGIRRRIKAPMKSPGTHGEGGRREGLLLWSVFWILLAFQLVQAVRLTYADGDDAFFVAESSVTEFSDLMYQVLPYTGGTTLLDARHSLAPFPIWIAYLSRISGMPAVRVAHVVLPVILISMTYTIFFLLGSRLFPGKDGRLPLFLIFSEILVLFGDYSFQSVENFMIARSRQGKAALGSIVIPFLLYLLLLLCQKVKEKQKLSPKLYMMFTLTALTGCLCSTLGAFLLCMLIGIAGLLVAALYKRWNVLIPMAVCCLPCVCYALVYLLSD